jgi:hypothetical protein
MKRWVLLPLLVSLPLAFARDSALAAGLGVTKHCTTPQPPNIAYPCDMSVTNPDPANTITLTSVTDTTPCNDPPFCTGGTSTAVQCKQNGVTVTTLGIAGSGFETCVATFTISAPACNSPAVTDLGAASGTTSATPPAQVSGFAQQTVVIFTCTPTLAATNTPTNTPRQTPIGTSTNTPTATPTVTPSNTTPTVTPTPSSRRRPRQPIVLPWRLDS